MAIVDDSLESMLSDLVDDTTESVDDHRILIAK